MRIKEEQIEYEVTYRCAETEMQANVGCRRIGTIRDQVRLIWGINEGDAKPKIEPIDIKLNVQKEMNCYDELLQGESDLLQSESVANQKTSTSTNEDQRKRSAREKKSTNQKKETKSMESKRTVVRKQNEHKCNICDYKTSTKSRLMAHNRVHSDEKPFACEICMKAFKRKYQLTCHTKTHGDLFPLRCSKCGLGFDQETAKNAHESNCQGQKFECNKCEYTTFVSIQLKRHMRTHSGEKLFKLFQNVCTESTS